MTLLEGVRQIYISNRQTDDGERCCCAPSPELQVKIDKALAKMRKAAPDGMEGMVALRRKSRVGYNDGLIVPGDLLPIGTPPAVARNVGLERAPLRGVVNVIVVLAEFSDRQFASATVQQDIDRLFFSTGQVPTGSVREFYTEATNGLITISGQVVGPYTMPDTLANYANGNSGTGATNPNARDLARDAANAADPDVNFAIYDNDGDGFVDAYVVVHAGPGAEQTGNPGHIWSHKWVMRSQMNADTTRLFAYLTVPEDARIGVCAHELGHLLFGFPDLYDTDSSSEGVGNWCLMGGGSWNGNGDTPAHPSAWCKANQGWATVTNITSNGVHTIRDVKAGNEIFRLWKDGGASQEYFLVENRQRTGFDAKLPGDGLCVWHIDDAISSNSDEAHPRVALEQADGLNHLGNAVNRGDGGDVYPGSTGNATFDRNSTPNSRSYAGNDTCVVVASISATAAVMTADLRVRCPKSALKDTPDKLFDKPPTIEKLFRMEKGVILEKPVSDKFPEKPDIDKRISYDKGWDFDFRDRFVDRPGRAVAGGLEARVAALEAALARVEPFIDAALRPRLDMSGMSGEHDYGAMQDEMEHEAVNDKRLMDVPGYRR